MRISLLILCVIALLGSCQRCYDDPRRPDPLVFYVVNAAGENLINDQGNSIYPDSVRARVGTERIALEKFYDPQTKGYKFRAYPGTNTDKTIVYLDLSSSDTDTLEVYSITHKGKCYNTIEYTDVVFNGNKVEKNLQTFEFAFVKR